MLATLCSFFFSPNGMWGSRPTSTKILSDIWRASECVILKPLHAALLCSSGDAAPQRGLRRDLHTILCILSAGSPSPECEAEDAKWVLDLLGRMQRASIFSGFFLIRVIKRGDSRFITQESRLSAVVHALIHALILLSSCCLILETYHVKLSTNKTPKTSGHDGFTIPNNSFCWCICYAILWRAITQICLAPYLYKYIINYLVVTKVNWKIFVKKLIPIFYLIF